MMLILPLFHKIISNNLFNSLLGAIVMFPLFFSGIANLISNPYLNEMISNIGSWGPTMLLGYIFANHNIFNYFDKVDERMKKHNWFRITLYLILVIILPFGRLLSKYIGIKLDVLLVPFYLFSLINLIKIVKNELILKPIEIIGKYSLLMWFTSCLFFGNIKQYTQMVLYAPFVPILVLALGLLLCLAMSLAIDFVVSKILKLKSRHILFK